MRPDAKQLAAVSVVTAALAAGVTADAQAAANPDEADVLGVISSYLGPLGLRDEFNRYLAEQPGYDLKKVVSTIFLKFAVDQNLKLPPGWGDNT